MSTLLPRPIETACLPDGSVLYLVDGAPAALPPVSSRDLLNAWDAAHRWARDGGWGVRRLFRFAAPADMCDVALNDADARSWADAVDAQAGLGTRHGLSLCLRLLALVDLLTRADWARRLIHLECGEAELHPDLVAFAAQASLDRHARFGEAALAAIAPACDLLAGTRGSIP